MAEGTCEEGHAVVQGVLRRGKGCDEGRAKAEGGGARRNRRRGDVAPSRSDRGDAAGGPRPGRAAPCDRHGNCADLMPKTWYGMRAYANKDGKVVCFFRGASKFDERYAMFGFNDVANLDEGAMWPVAFGLTKLSPRMRSGSPRS